MKYIKKIRKFRRLVFCLAALLVLLANLSFLPKVFASTLTNTAVVELAGSGNPMVAGAGNELAVEFKTVNAVTSPSITLTFSSSWTANSGAISSSQTIASGGSGCNTFFPNSPTGLTGSVTASGSGSTITISNANNLVASTAYCTELTGTSAVTNPTAGAYSVTISDVTDNQTDALDVLSSGGNAYNITATVLPTFTMSLSGSTDTIATLSASSIKTSTGITTTVSTNANSGWIVWIKDSNSGLTSSQAGHTISSGSADTNHTLTAGTEGYVLAGIAGSGSPTIQAPFSVGSGSSGSGMNGTFYEIASNSGPSSNNTFTTEELVAISNTTPPASDYTDTITETGAGQF